MLISYGPEFAHLYKQNTALRLSVASAVSKVYIIGSMDLWIYFLAIDLSAFMDVFMFILLTEY